MSKLSERLFRRDEDAEKNVVTEVRTLEQALEEARAELVQTTQDRDFILRKLRAAYDNNEGLDAKREELRAELAAVEVERDAALEECSNLRDSNEHEKARARLTALRECAALCRSEDGLLFISRLIENDIKNLIIDAEESKGSKP